jgi:hypothetical protein
MHAFIEKVLIFRIAGFFESLKHWGKPVVIKSGV